MLTHTATLYNPSSADTLNHAGIPSSQANIWEEYSSFHDSFTEQLAYENSRRQHSDIWHLNYI